MSKNRTKKLYTIFIATLPLFSVYASGVPGFTLGDIMLFLFFLYRIFIGVKNKSINIPMKTVPIIWLVVAIIVLSIISMLGQGQADTNVSIRIIRRIFYYLSVVLVSSEWFDAAYGKKVIVVVGKIGAIYLFIQYIAYYVCHIVLHGYLPFLPVYHERYAQLDYQALYSSMFRPTSFLLEPAHFSRYLCIPLVLTIFDDNCEEKWLWAFVMSGAIIASTSGIGTICVIFIWGIWFFRNQIRALYAGKIRPKHIVLFIVFVGVLLFSTKMDIVQLTIQRIVNTRLTDINTAGGARFRGYLQYFQLPLFNLIVGKGYGNTPLTSWFSGASYILYGCGIIGFFVCVLMFYMLFIFCNDAAQRTLCVIFFLLFFMDDCFMSHVSVTFLTFICMDQSHGLEMKQIEQIE